MRPLNASVLPQLGERFPGLKYGFQGRQAHFKESVDALFKGLALALVALYFLLGVPFRSYAQPLVVMIAIPFGAVGALVGHVVMGYALNLLSLMGVIALAGVVVNDALVLVDYANRRRKEGHNAFEAAALAATRRFRPVLLTTLTTFGGLAPMIFETSRQARFIIPMALSLGFGIVFATAITLCIVPALYVIVDDLTGRREAAMLAAPAE
jgi:multidrug efflux pump subunit AcrB